MVSTRCQRSENQNNLLISVDVTANYPKKELILQDFMDVEYIPLETTDDFITMAYVQDIGKNIIIVRNRNKSSDGDIFLFDKSGKGLRKINHQGPGVGEYKFLMQITLDEENDELFINDHQSRKIFVYDMFGRYKRSFDHREGSIYDPVYNFDKNNLICLDYITDFEEEPRNRFFIISKLDGSVTKEIEIPVKSKKSTVLISKDETTGTTTVSAARNQELIRNNKNWILVDPSSDTIYSAQPDLSVNPFIIRSPSIQSMNPEIFLFPGVVTNRYYFMQTARKEYNFATDTGFPRTDLMYDKQEKAIYEYVVYNEDLTINKPVNMVYEITLINNEEIAFIQKLEAFELVEAYEKNQLKGELKEVTSMLNEESNPVLMIVKHRK